MNKRVKNDINSSNLIVPARDLTSILYIRNNETSNKKFEEEPKKSETFKQIVKSLQNRGSRKLNWINFVNICP